MGYKNLEVDYFVLSQSTRLTDRQADRQMSCRQRDREYSQSHGKNRAHYKAVTSGE